MVDLEPVRPAPPAEPSRVMASCSFCRAAVFLVDLEVHERYCFTTMSQARLVVPAQPSLEDKADDHEGKVAPVLPPPRVVLPLDAADCPHCGLPVEIVIMEEHALSCRFQPRVCNLCGERVPLFLCGQHLETVHPVRPPSPDVVETVVVIDHGALALPAADSSAGDTSGPPAQPSGDQGLLTVSELTLTMIEPAPEAAMPAAAAAPAPSVDYTGRADMVILKHALGLGAMVKEGSPDGCEVVQLTPQGRADRAGVLVGETITAVDGTRLPNPNVLAIISKRVKGFTEEDHEWEVRSKGQPGTTTRTVIF